MTDVVLDRVSVMVGDIREAVGAAPVVVSKVVIVLEEFDLEGQRCLRFLSDEQTESWEVRGMLSAVLSNMDSQDTAYIVNSGWGEFPHDPDYDDEYE